MALCETYPTLRDNGVKYGKYYRYYTFGETQSEMVNLNQAYKYTGKPMDTEFDLDIYYYGARYYNPMLGRWLAVDPQAGKYPSNSPYAYSLNNPVKFVDPDGELPWLAIAAAAIYIVLSTPEYVQAPTTDGGHVEQTFGEKVLQWGSALAGAAGILKVGQSLDIGKAALNDGSVEKAGITAAKDKITPGKPFTQSQKKTILETNRQKNFGVLRSDKSGEDLIPAKQHKAGVTPPANEAHVDHIVPRSKGGQNTLDNARVLSREENLKKSDKLQD